MTELILRGNNITDDGTRALAALLSSDSGLRFIDLRENRISKQGVKVLVDALERSNRVRHVYVYANGKIEAMGTNIQELSSSGEGGGYHEKVTKSNVPMVKVETVCIIDIMNNNDNEPKGQITTAGSIVKGRSSSESTFLDVPILRTSRTTVQAPSHTKDVRNKIKKTIKSPKSLQHHSASGKSNKKSYANIVRSQDQLPMLPLSPKDNAATSLDKKSRMSNSQINKGQQVLTSGFKQDVKVH